MYKNILVPIAFDGDDAKADAAIGVAKSLAEEGAKITLLHVIEMVPAYAMTYVPDDLVAQTRLAIKAELKAMADAVTGAEAVVVDGHASRTILDYADENDIDLIVIASHRPGMQDLLIGSTAAQVVRHAKASVHVLR